MSRTKMHLTFASVVSRSSLAPAYRGAFATEHTTIVASDARAIRGECISKPRPVELIGCHFKPVPLFREARSPFRIEVCLFLCDGRQSLPQDRSGEVANSLSARPQNRSDAGCLPGTFAVDSMTVELGGCTVYGMGASRLASGLSRIKSGGIKS